MRGAVLALAALVSGCASPSGSVGAAELPLGVAYAPRCGTLPDGSAFDCVASTWARTLAEPPGYVAGWKCHSTWSHPGMRTEVWSNRDGRMGLFWEWERWKPDGLAWQRLAVYLSGTQGGVLNTAYSPRGFAHFEAPFEPSGPIYVYAHLHQYRAWIKDEGGWRVAPEVEFFVNSQGPQFWVTARITLPERTYHVDLMMAVGEGDDDPNQWSLRPFQATLDGYEILFAQINRGAKYPNIDYAAMVRNPVNCGRVPNP